MLKELTKKRSAASEKRMSLDRSRESSAPELIDLRAFSQRFLPRNVSLSNYIRYMRTLLPEAYHDLLLGYFYGGEYVRDPASLIESPSLSDEQLSIVCQTLVQNGVAISEFIDSKIHSELASFVEDIRKTASKRLDSAATTGFIEFTNLINATRRRSPSVVRTLGEFESLVSYVKTELVHVIGPDLFTILQQLCDPDHAITDRDTVRQLQICRSWGVADLYVQLLILRATRNVALDDQPLKLVISQTLGEGTPNALAPTTLAIYASWTSPDDALPADILGSPATALKLVCAVRRELAEGNAERLVDIILALYDIDPTMMEWLDWRSIYRTMRFSLRLEGLKIAAIHFLMGQPFVARKFRVVAIAEGDGAFESSLRTSISRLRTLDALSAELSSLSYRCRKLLINAILSPDTAAMLTVILQHDPRWARQLTKARSLAYDTRVSALRLDLANSFARAGLLERRHAQIIIEEEQSRLRVAYLQGRRQNGLVHIDWSRILVRLNNEFSAQVGFVKKLLNEQNLDQPAEYRQSVVSALAEAVTDFILIEGPDNFKTTISDSLRHGQLPNLFLTAFDRAISQSTASAIDGSSLMAELSTLEPYCETWLLRLRAAQVETIKRFNNECLSVSSPSPFRTQAEAEVAKCIDNALSSSSDVVDLGQCLKSMKILLESFLHEAGQQLTKRLKEYKELAAQITSDVDEVVLPTNPPRTVDGYRFLHALRESLNEAEQESLPWLALTEAKATPDAFHLRDLVQLCLLNHRSDSRQPTVEVTISEHRVEQGIVILPNPKPISGKYFPLFESLTKNILLNAFSHSGLGLRTKLAIELILADARLTIKAKSTISPAKYQALRDRINTIQAEANKGNLSAAGEDTGSGLQKMRWMINRYLNVTPALRLSLLSDPSSFELAIETKHSHVDIISSESPGS
ncbi:hypothetical protein [Bradyrhizobium sp. 142]|uniref:hypothetical protein n=1 Tax=Bradyrhizobium sp. 142 TaxID=2782618 RepID=UPI001FF816B3|nr:hypothetical protein [Bradyrhizobium sp. 142]MCK1728250.1 hypothetical protein [Bradyrhizobium sp. 142]